MTRYSLSLLLFAAAALFSVDAFAPSVPVGGVTSSCRQSTSLSMAVVDIDGEAAFDKTIQNAGDSLVVVDYSTTWCGPCKVIAPKFDEFSEKYPDAVFLKVIGDASPDASKLMKREGVRSVPSFHYFMKGEKVDVVNGANAEAIEAAITKHIK
ncbi:thioredoxin domain containing protein [Nitzschia inconspicua]|uniref:Thioredoxin domain containing protein n=1 Tax=Nitzschia inconspicua TaxID=303405 RepID=A0A9K3LRB7_9STRA|nr:thioredoxin domain containing protein [Nitzschia inconspicua]KAG7367114.1 thioredoxin domain containing protein [Nitzschia inconspicua]